jgi:membrane dipeptidase
MSNLPSAWSRRAFLTALGGTSAAMMLNPLKGWAIGEMDPRVAAIVASTIGIDTHNHIDVPMSKEEALNPEIDLAADLKKSGLSAICMTFATDYKHGQVPGEAYERFVKALDAMDAILAKNHVKRALNLSDLKAAHKKHQPIVVQSVEGSHFLEGKLDRVEYAYKRGLRHMGLLHDSDASTPLGDVYTNPPTFNGLTEFGASVIKECNRLGMLIDLAHASADTVSAALKITQHPVLVSHTGLDTRLGSNPDMAKMMMPRLISAEHAKIIADAGGVIGVWTHLAATPLEYAQNIRALVDIIGVDHVAIGTDTKLTPGNRRPGSDNRPHPGERTNYAWEDQKEGFYYIVADALLKTGFTEEEIGKIGGGNFCRVFDAATTGH